MNQKSKIKLYEELLKQHGYSICSICNSPIIKKEDKVNIIREEYKDNKIKRRIIDSFHKKCK